MLIQTLKVKLSISIWHALFTTMGPSMFRFSQSKMQLVDFYLRHNVGHISYQRWPLYIGYPLTAEFTWIFLISYKQKNIVYVMEPVG